MSEQPEGATATAPPPPSEPGPPQPRPPFWRTAGDKVFAGVAGGLARTFGMDPVVVRIITVVICVSFPPALIAYLAAWLLVARDDRPSSRMVANVALREPGGVAFWLGVIVLAGLLAAAVGGDFDGGFGLLPLLLVGIGVALWTREGGGSRSPAAAWPQASGGTAVDTLADGVPRSGGETSVSPSGSSGEGPDRPTPPPSGPPPAHVEQPRPPQPDPTPPRPRSPLGAITLAFALIVTGIVAALDMVAGVPLDVDPTHLAAVALLVLGLGQLVGALWGRARWLTLVALLLIPPVLAGATFRAVEARTDLASGLDLGDGIGERTLRPAGADELPDDLRLLAGSIEVDLEDWQPSAAELAALAEDDSDLTLSVGVGEVLVTTPDAVPWRVVADIGIGDTSVTRNADLLERQSTEDLDSSLEVVRTGGPQDGPVLDIIVDLRAGEFDLHTRSFDQAAFEDLTGSSPATPGPATPGPITTPDPTTTEDPS